MKEKCIKILSIIATIIVLSCVSIPTYAKTINMKAQTIYIGQEKQLTVNPSNTSTKYKWTSSNKGVLTCTKTGKIKGKKQGTATVTAKANENTYKFKVNVKQYVVKLAIVHTSQTATLNEQNMIASLSKTEHCTITRVTNINNLDTNKYDGLIVPGGADMSPSWYGEQNTASYGINIAHDKLMFQAIKKFREAKKPILGICAGMQYINVAYGGSLKQDIGKVTGKYHYGTWRKININKKSVFTSFGSKVNVKHYHHQAVKKLGKGLRITMRDAKDKEVEGIEGIDEPTYGLQWHPDLMGNSGKKIFRIFIEICRKRTIAEMN